MLDMHRQLSSAGADHERTLLACRIEARDRQIDRQICRAVRTDRGGDRAGGGLGRSKYLYMQIDYNVVCG